MPVSTQTPTRLDAGRIPELEPGDRLTRDEFERRYEAMPGVKKAELIEGIVYMPSPVRNRRHGRPHSHLNGLLFYYAAKTEGVQLSDNATVRLDDFNEPQPDVLLMIEPGRGGQAIEDSDDYISGAPELVAEIASSSVSFDLNTKLEVYQRTGVLEYVVWRVGERAIDWFIRRGKRFKRIKPDSQGILRSEVFPGLWLDTVALLDSDLDAALRSLDRGLASPEHAAFVKRLEGSS